MLRTGEAHTPTGETVRIHSQIRPELIEPLYRTVRERQPDVAVEVGMAFGMSSLAILSALNANGRGRLISIDPFQSSQWHGAGVAAVARSGFASRHTLIEAMDHLVLLSG